VTRALFAALSLSCSFAAACAPAGPPPVTPAMAQRAHMPEASLERGREVFTSHCARCHELPAPNAESPAGWPARVDDMGKRAGIGVSDHDDLLRYLVAAHD
jgi:mono/diheme cytochrome c family protein